MKRVIFSFALLASSVVFANADMDLSVSCNDVVAAQVEACVMNEATPAVCELSIQMPVDVAAEAVEVTSSVTNS
jgi:hypothetical protein